MRFMFLIPLFGAALLAIGMMGGEAHPVAPYMMTGSLGAALALFLVRKDLI